jgi:hypothetical protein
VDLARRMNISADDAIRQYMDLGRRNPTSARGSRAATRERP